MRIEFYPPNKKENSFIVLNNNEMVRQYASFVFFNDKTVVACAEDAFRKTNGDISYYGKTKWHKVVQAFNDKIAGFSECNMIYTLPCNDFIMIGNDLKLLIFADSVKPLRLSEKTTAFSEIQPVSERDDFSLYEIKGETVEDVWLSEYDLYCPTMFAFSNDKMLVVYCFWKLLDAEDNTVLVSYEFRNKRKKRNIKKFEKIIGSKISDIYSYGKFIYILYFDNGYKLYIYIDNRYYNVPQIKIFNGFNVNKLIYNKGALVSEKLTLSTESIIQPNI